jgi:hypothetical protein
MIVLDLAAVALVVIAALSYRELRAVAKVARAHYKIQGLHRF